MRTNQLALPQGTVTLKPQDVDDATGTVTDGSAPAIEVRASSIRCYQGTWQVTLPSNVAPLAYQGATYVKASWTSAGRAETLWFVVTRVQWPAGILDLSPVDVRDDEA